MRNPEAMERLLAFARTVPGADTAVIQDAMALKRLHRQVQALFEWELEAHDLSPSRLEVLEVLYHHPGQALSPAELADEAVVTRAAMTGIVDDLEKKGYVRRRPHAHDRRMISVELTAKGKRFTKDILADRYRKGSAIIGCLSRAERRAMIDFYTRLVEACRAELGQEA